MIDRSFGHYVRVLVDMNLAEKLRYRLLVERKGYAFFVDLDYENFPDFCSHCNITSHHFDNFRRRKGVNIEIQPKEQTKKSATVSKQVLFLNKKNQF